jgi:hypothetical protein
MCFGTQPPWNLFGSEQRTCAHAPGAMVPQWCRDNAVVHRYYQPVRTPLEGVMPSRFQCTKAVSIGGQLWL